jgi:hypothetical protein
VAGNSEELLITARMKDFASAEFKRLGGVIGGFARGAVSGVKGVVDSLFSLKGMIATAATAWGGMKAIDIAANLEGVELAFGNLSRAMGGSNEVLEAMRAGTKGTANDLDLMRSANEAMMAGIVKTAPELENLATMARRLGQAVGQDALTSFSDLSLGIARQSPQILDNLKIYIKLEEATQAYAESKGKEADALSASEKKQAFMNAVLESGAKKLRELGPEVETLADSWGQFKTELANTGLDVLREMTPLLKDIFKSVTQFVKDEKPAIMGFFADVVEASSGAIAAIADAVSKMEGYANKFGGVWQAIKDPMGVAPRAFRDAIRDSLGILPEVNAKLGESIRESGSALAQHIRNLGHAGNAANEFSDGMGEACDDAHEFGTALTAEAPNLKEWEQELKDSAKWQAEWNKAWEQGQQLLARQTFGGGARAAFRQMAEEAKNFGDIASKSILGVRDALSDNLGDALIDIASKTKHAKEAWIDFATAFAREVAKMGIQMAIQLGINSLGSLFSSSNSFGGSLGPSMGGIAWGAAKGGTFAGHFDPIDHLALGSPVVRQRGLYELGEGKNFEAVVPLPDNRSIPVRFTGGGEGQSQTVYNVNITYTAPTTSEEKRMIARNSKLIADQVVRQMNSSMSVREGMR